MKPKTLTVSLPALYDKVNRTEPALLRALVRGSAARLAPVMTAAGTGHPSLPGYALRVLDGNHLPGSEKRLKPLRALRGAALPGLTLVVYDPDTGLAVDLVAAEDAYTDERTLARGPPGWRCARSGLGRRSALLRPALAGGAGRGGQPLRGAPARQPSPPLRAGGLAGVWLLRDRHAARAEHHPGGEPDPLAAHCAQPDDPDDGGRPDALAVDQPARERQRGTDRAGVSATLAGRGPVPAPGAGAAQRGRPPGSPASGASGVASAVLAHNVLSLLSACIETVHGSEPRVSVFHLGRQIAAGYEGLMVALGHAAVLTGREGGGSGVAARLLALAERVDVGRIATSPRGPKRKVDKPYVAATVAREHVSTARVLQKAKLMAKKTP